MSTLFTILIVVLLLIVAVLIIAAFSKKTYAVEREIVIAKHRNEVFDYVKYLKNQDHYSKWVMTDPAMKKEFTGVDGTVGFIYAWDGNQKAGKGAQEIISIDEGNKIDIEVRFIRPFEGIAKTPITTTTISENATSVVWGMESTMKYPMNIMLLVLNMEKMLGNDLEISLKSLKTILEAK